MKIQELRNLIRNEVRKAINESTSKRRLKEDTTTIDTYDYSKLKQLILKLRTAYKNSGGVFDNSNSIFDEIEKIGNQLGIDMNLDSNKKISATMLFKIRSAAKDVDVNTVINMVKEFLTAASSKPSSRNKLSLDSTKALSSINYSKVTNAFKEMKKSYFEDESAQEDFINEINNIVKQLGIDIDLVDEPDFISYFLETVQEDNVSVSSMLRELKSLLQELLDEFSGHTRM